MDIIFGRFAPTDYTTVHQLIRRIAVRANGMGMYYSLIDPTREKFPVTPVPSKPATPIGVTPMPSRPHSPDRHSHASHHDNLQHTPDHASHLTGRHKSTAARSRHHHHAHSSSPFHIHHRHPHHRSQSHHHNMLHSSLLHLALSRTPRSEFAVGVFESQRYLNLEVSHLSHPESNRFTDQATGLLNASCAQLLEVCGSGLEGVQSWLDHVRDHRFDFWVSRSEKERIRKGGVQNYERIRDELSRVLDDFRKDKRNIVLDPYRPALSADYDGASIDNEVPPHRYLFHCYVYQYHLMQFSILLVALFDEIIKLEQHRKRNRLWVPSMPLKKLLSWSNWDATENLGKDDDENPEIIPGMEPSWMSDLGKAARRDPDALPPRNALEMIMNIIYRVFTNMGGGNVLFAVKAGALTVLLSLPSFFKSTASYAYKNKFVWAVFMGQLTLARFRGDTTFGLVARIGSTFCGGIVGMVMWYVSAGSGHGNPYGLLAVFAVCFPFFFFARLYWPGPPMVNMIFFVTTALVVGYSYQDTHLYIPSSPGWGFDVSWRRFLLVTIGVTAACIFSFFPPNTTIRSYQRRTLATTSAEIGSIYCSIVSFANIPRQEDVQQIVQSLVAIRSKLSRSIVLRTNVVYEFSLRGQWPAERYQKIVEIQLEVAYLLSHLMSVVEHLEPAWSHAFLRRTRLLDSDFQGDVLAVISLISFSLRTGSPLPQITPCPLLDRFMLRHHGLNVIHQESEDDYGLPRTLTLETLENEQYLIFCVGVSTVFGIVTRLDHLMVAVKELVGEQYHIHGVGLGHHRKPAGVEMSSPTISMRPMQDV
ncbi:hypothetical protein SERLA73DRAFT_183808 [Serpula lacrymans var. lacrymans S7.3]|uniref:DUF2421 domain-containing protein n=1 Tax=Serpula lacrymans var. lacrymans (strain S7.3) TaxID=936435 RepID=F8Q1V8_SERL3|nr:hypothetical protein SERLA73DRAFT_183808 [Serpula lacrymans var. lacrymans S7.3]